VKSVDDSLEKRKCEMGQGRRGFYRQKGGDVNDFKNSVMIPRAFSDESRAEESPKESGYKLQSFIDLTASSVNHFSPICL
jgi:hypothetical protein